MEFSGRTINDGIQLKGQLLSRGSLSGKINTSGRLTASISLNPYYDKYSGPYKVTPAVDTQTMYTENKVMTSNVNIQAIPYYEVSNKFDGITAIIGTIPKAQYKSVSAISSGNNYVITAYFYGTYYAITHDGTDIGVQRVQVSNGEITSEVTESMLWSDVGNKLGFAYDGTTYYMTKSGYSTLGITTSGTTASYRNSRLYIGNFYLRFSGGYFYLSRNNYSTVYMFEENWNV